MPQNRLCRNFELIQIDVFLVYTWARFDILTEFQDGTRYGHFHTFRVIWFSINKILQRKQITCLLQNFRRVLGVFMPLNVIRKSIR